MDISVACMCGKSRSSYIQKACLSKTHQRLPFISLPYGKVYIYTYVQMPCLPSTQWSCHWRMGLQEQFQACKQDIEAHITAGRSQQRKTCGETEQHACKKKKANNYEAIKIRKGKQNSIDTKRLSLWRHSRRSII